MSRTDALVLTAATVTILAGATAVLVAYRERLRAVLATIDQPDGR